MKPLKPENHRNPDGTYNGISFMAALSGLTQDEIRWTFERTKALLATGLPRDEVVKIVKREAAKRFGGQ